jgi:hypothetical protein
LGEILVKSFAEAEEYLSKGRNKNDRPLENNTRLIRHNNGEIAVRLHNTDVVIYNQRGRIRLNSGGWRTVTTKDRINRYSPVNVYSNRGVWFVNSDITEFYDGLVVDNAGSLLTAPRWSDKTLRTKMLNRIKRYVDGYMTKLNSGLPLPGSGDCWDCYFIDKNNDNRSLGDISKSDHVKSHLEERYYVPSLLINALREKGYRYPEIIAGIHGDMMGGSSQQDASCRLALRQYLKRRLMPDNHGSKPV